MKKSAGRRLAAFGLTAALAISAITVPGEASAAKAVKKVTVNKKKVTLYPGADANYGSIKIKAKINPKGAKAKLKWKSSKKKVATVNSKGLIKAKKAGKATITVKAGKKSAKVKVTVKKIKKKVSKVTVANSSLTINKNQTASIKASVAPAKATLKKLTYKSANTKVASVTAKGVVKGLQAGSTTITVRAVDGSKKQAKATVKVVDATKPGVVNPTKAPVVVPSVAPSTKPSTEPTVAPSTKPSTEPTSEPTTAPTSEPSTEPTTEPTSEPTTAPTSEPTTAPTSEPTTAPTSEPTTAPTSEPTTEPTSGPVEPIADPEIPGNVKYTLDAEKEYEAKATVLGKEIDLNTTDATADLADKALSKALNGMTEFYGDVEAYKNKVIAPKSYTVADGATITVSKDKMENAWEYGLKLKLSGVSEDLNGEYSTMVSLDGEGQYAITPNAKYFVNGNDWGKGNSFTLRFAESALVTDAQGNQTMTYDIDELSLKVGDDEKKLATGKDVSDNIRATVTKTADGAETFTVERNNRKIVIKKDASGYSYSIPEDYQERYGIQLASK